MKKIASLHLEYLLNKMNIFVFSICTLIFSIAISSNLIDVYSSTSYMNKSEIYLEGSLILFEIFSVILSCFIFSFNFLKEKDEYRYLCVKKEDEKKLFLIKKIIVSLMFLYFFELINLMVLLLMGYLGVYRFCISSIYHYKIFFVLLQVIYYGFLSMLLVKLCNNLFTIMLPMLGKFMSLYLVDSKNEIAKLITFLFPSSANGDLSNVFLICIEVIVLFYIVIYLDVTKEY